MQEAQAMAPSAPANPHIRDAVERLALARRVEADAAAVVKASKDAWQANEAGHITVAMAAQQSRETFERELRELALAHYQTTHEKAPCPGVAIVGKVAFDVDEALALEHARKTGQGLIPESVDLWVLEKIAKAAPGSVPGITLREEPSVRIATDLDAALAGGAQ